MAAAHDAGQTVLGGALVWHLGLPGGSPGPVAEASGKLLLFFVVFSLAVTAAMLWFMFYIAAWAASLAA